MSTQRSKAGAMGPSARPHAAREGRRETPAGLPPPSRRIGRPPGDAQGRASAREAYYRAQTRKIEQEIRVRLGQLVEAAAVDRTWAAMVISMREKMLTLPTTARQRGLVDAAGEDALRVLVEQALAELAAR